MDHFREIMYTLKQQFGTPLGLYQRGTDTVDLKTGLQTIVETKFSIRKAIVLPFSLFLKLFKYNNKGQFDYGGDLSNETRIFIIDRRDPVLFNVTVDNKWFVVCDHKRYTIKILENYNIKDFYVLTGSELPNSDVIEQYDISLQDWIYVTDDPATGS